MILYKPALVVLIYHSLIMISEETPLVSSLTTRKHEVYKRFKPAKKRAIVALVSVTGLLARAPFHLSCEFCVSLRWSLFSLRIWDFRAVDTANSKRPEHYRYDREVTEQIILLPSPFSTKCAQFGGKPIDICVFFGISTWCILFHFL